MIATRQLQRHFADGFIAEAVADLWEPWMRHADAALEDDTSAARRATRVGQTLQEEQDSWGASGTSADVVLRMLLLKHVRDWSFEVLTRRGARQSGLSRVYPGRRRKGPG